MDFSKYNIQLFFSFIDKNNNIILFGTKTGFYVYTMFPFTKIIENKFSDGIVLIKNKELTNIFYFIKKNENKNLHIWDQNLKKIINTIKFRCTIVDISITKNYIIIIFEHNLTIYDSQFKFLKQINDTNINKLYCINTSKEVLYYLNINNTITSINLNNLNESVCNYSNTDLINNITINYDNTLMAISNTKGTIINIFDIVKNKITRTLRRGLDETEIRNIDFNKNSEYLIVDSIKGTIHLYNLKSVSYFSILGEYSVSKLYFKNIQCCYILFVNKNIVITDTTGNFNIITYNGNLVVKKSYKFLLLDTDPFQQRENLIV